MGLAATLMLFTLKCSVNGKSSFRSKHKVACCINDGNVFEKMERFYVLSTTDRKFFHQGFCLFILL
ncbi:CLUMA_CG021191, isoform A [Clunio marinus]|uniref:CLUMA_CG021191, isoform A n=1 Tax=Clunio marinus TaxID=568069 RepID=A0A1J1J8X1_9DIPT|nr:CLUMA_CG021191, isoform A [Clunio marinus]